MAKDYCPKCNGTAQYICAKCMGCEGCCADPPHVQMAEWKSRQSREGALLKNRQNRKS